MSAWMRSSFSGGDVPVILLAPKIGWLKRSCFIVASGMSNAARPEPRRSATKTTRSVESQSDPLPANFCELRTS